METYNKSILKYRDVRSAVELAEERYYEKGIKAGIEAGIEKGIKRGIERGIKITARKFLKEGIPIDLVSRVTGLTPEQIKQKN